MQVRSAGATAARRRAAAEYARGVTQRVRYAETRKVTSEASISKIFTAKLGRERTLTDLPLNRADLFFEFEGLVKELRAAGYDIVVGLDELDKLQVDDDAIRFLNDMKVLFTISECSFLVTISQNAWSQFERRGLPLRDVFDSSLDAVVRVEPLAFVESRSFIRRRAGDMFSDTAIALCHCLSGGLPRDLLRYARALGEVNDELPGNATTLERITAEVTRTDVAGKIRAILLSIDGADQLSTVQSSLAAELRDLAGEADLSNWLPACMEFIDEDADFRQHVFTSRGEVRQPSDRQNATNGQKSGQEESHVQQIRREFFSYLYIIELIYLVFSGTDDGLFNREPTEIIRVVDQLAHSKRQLESDLTAAWREASTIREALMLEPL